MARIAHLSDLHFPKVNAHAVDVLLDDLDAWRPDLVAISGDFVQLGGVSEFKLARAFLDRIEQPCLTVPGNHDIPSLHLLSRFFRPFARYRRYIADDLAPFFENHEFAAIGVNTARPFGLYWDWSRGRVSYNQMESIRRAFAATNASKVRVVVTHHPFLLNAETVQRRLVGRNRQALAVFQDAGVDLLLAGHLHRTIIGLVGEIREEIDRPSPLVVAQAATALSTRLKQQEMNAYHRIHVVRDEIRIEPWHWTDRSRFEAGPATAYRRLGATWQPRPCTGDVPSSERPEPLAPARRRR